MARWSSQLHWGGLAFLIYAAASLSWAPVPRDSAFGLCQVAIWAGAFWFGARSADLRPLWRVMAVLLSVSSAVAVLQSLGWSTVESLDHPAGLLFNAAAHGALLALVIIALVCARDWAFIPALLPGLVLAQSRGAWLVLASGLAARYLHWTTVVLLVSASAAIAIAGLGIADGQRLLAWRIAAEQTTLLGLGAGSFVDIVIQNADGALIRPEYAHNDYLQLACEYGIGALPLALIMARAIGATEARDWPVFAGFAVLAGFFFPLYVTPLAVVGATVAGHLVRT